MKLNIGCGERVRPGYIGVDFRELPTVDKVHDLTKPLPFEDDSVDEIFACHIIEHLILVDAQSLLYECYRVLKKGGMLDIWTPNFDEVKYVKSITKLHELMFGVSRYHGARHQSTFSISSLSALLTGIGFIDVSVLDEHNINEYPFKAHIGNHQFGMRCLK